MEEHLNLVSAPPPPPVSPPLNVPAVLSLSLCFPVCTLVSVYVECVSRLLTRLLAYDRPTVCEFLIIAPVQLEARATLRFGSATRNIPRAPLRVDLKRKKFSRRHSHRFPHHFRRTNSKLNAECISGRNHDSRSFFALSSGSSHTAEPELPRKCRSEQRSLNEYVFPPTVFSSSTAKPLC